MSLTQSADRGGGEVVLEIALNHLAGKFPTALFIDSEITHIPTDFNNEVVIGRSYVARYLRPFRYPTLILNR